MNLIEGRIEKGLLHLPGENTYRIPERWRKSLNGRAEDGRLIMGFRPEAAEVRPDGEIRAEVYASDLHGAYTMLHMALNGEASEDLVHARAGRGGRHAIGESIQFNLDPKMVRFFDAETEAAIYPEEHHG
jgi:ABC-type sugar transport system ATPase subunit